MAIKIYTAKDGLPSTYVTSTYQDKLGYLWVGSPSGLSRFDGKYFTNYGIGDGLPDTRAAAGLMDNHLRFWAFTPRGAIEYKSNKFISYAFEDSENIRWVFQVLETKEGHIWCLTNAGIYQFNLNKWVKIKLYPGYENNSCTTIIETDEGVYINYGNLLVLKKPDGTYKIIGGLKTPGYYYNTLSISAGRIFISTLDGIYEIKHQQLVKIPGLLGRLKGLYTYFRDNKKRFWIAINNIGIQLLPEGDTSIFLQVYKGPTNFLIQYISEDKQGNIWVSTGNGLLRISEMGFESFDAKAITGKNILRNVLQPPGSPLIVNNGTLNLKVFEKGQFKNRKLQNGGKASLPDNELIIDNYAFDDKSHYWYEIRGWVLAMQEGDKIYEQSGQLAHLGDQVFDILFDTYRKKLLAAVRTQKFPCQFNNASYGALTVSNNIDVQGEIMHLHQCTNGIILFSTDKGLIYSIDKKNICKLQLNEFNAKGLIGKFCNDPSGDVWIIYRGRGLRRYSWVGDALNFKEEITKANGLSNDNVNSLCFDNNNKLWVCTNSNVVVFSKKMNALNNQTYQIESFFDATDLQVEDFYDCKMAKDLKGDIWLLTQQHLICFYPDKINYNLSIPDIQIESIKLNLQQTNWADYTDSLSPIFQLPCYLQLSHENNTLGFYFKGISTSGTEGIKYSYMLKGLENLWTIPSSNDFVSFVKLPPGKYVFQVKAQFVNTNWSEPAIISFAIKKAFWQTWWFYILIAITLSSVIYIIFRYRFMQKIKLLEMRNRISQDLHDEIGASLSGINLLSQMAAEKVYNNKNEEATDYLLKVKNYTQDVIEKLSDMVWIFNPQNDSIEKLLQRLRSFAMSIAMSKNIKMHFVSDKESEIKNLSIGQRKALYLISKEAINNSLKYASCSNIYYSLKPNGTKWQLQIKDDGKGFTLSENENGNGLKNMKARADEIGASISIESQIDIGTIISVEA